MPREHDMASLELPHEFMMIPPLDRPWVLTEPRKIQFNRNLFFFHFPPSPFKRHIISRGYRRSTRTRKRKAIAHIRGPLIFSLSCICACQRGRRTEPCVVYGCIYALVRAVCMTGGCTNKWTDGRTGCKKSFWGWHFDLIDIQLACSLLVCCNIDYPFYVRTYVRDVLTECS
ncbi:hypothetical protein M434DRAFT_105136 [Hypoxylon sp. CO27-5]|nr:hypothetical protein M434DRAFT_105136 [Hypoxylon sp. CO27-5]